jgi:hypothetical protein
VVCHEGKGRCGEEEEVEAQEVGNPGAVGVGGIGYEGSLKREGEGSGGWWRVGRWWGMRRERGRRVV